MITDVFHKRYPAYWWFGDYHSDGPYRAQKFFVQACHILDDMAKQMNPKFTDEIYTRAHNKLVRELGWGMLNNESSTVERCFVFIATPYDLWNNKHGDFNEYNARRLSLVELLFREHEDEIIKMSGKENRKDTYRLLIQGGISELNGRMREAKLGLHYHSGVLQIADDVITTGTIREPFWEITKGDKWSNVDREMKEAVDHKDRGEADAHFHAMKSLESTLKVVSDERGLTTGNERGAVNYIDNLLRAGIIKSWEGDILKIFFKEIRNPAGHGSGSKNLTLIPPYEVDLIIESAMSLIKSLIRRQ